MHDWTLSRAARAVAGGEVTARALTEHVLERIAEVDSKLHAYAIVCEERAMTAATRADELGADGRPLHGVPIGLKDLCDTEGIRTRAGMPCFDDRVPARNATVVQRLIDAGAIVVGKLEMAEAAGPLHHPLVAAPVNPYVPELWTGISSSGSGVAVAAGLCFGATGSDTAGSIRFPSACNGVVGLMPTEGRVPKDGIVPLCPSLEVVGPMARTVEDVARMFSVMAGAADDDTTTVARPAEDFVEAVEAGARGLVVGIDEEYCTKNVGTEVSAALFAAVEVLKERGVTVRPVEVPAREEALRAFCVVFHSELTATHEKWIEEHGGEYGPHFSAMVDVGRGLSAMDYARAHAVRREFRGRLTRFFHGIDAMICPPVMASPPPAEAMQYIPPNMADLLFTLELTPPYNFAGVPTLSLPCGRTDEGAPLGMQIVAPWFDEAKLLRIGGEYQRATEWHRQRPEI